MVTDIYSLTVQKNVQRFQILLLSWFQKNCRRLPWRETKNPYFIWVSEVMLQQTQVVSVIPYYELFITEFPDPSSLANATLQDVLKVWEGLGYYARARNLYKSAKLVVEKYGGKIPQNYLEFRQLPGVGDYIASAVLSIAFNQTLPVLDGNVKRVLARLYLIQNPVNVSKFNRKFLEKANQLLSKHQPGDYNQAIMELGAVFCRPKKPLCQECVVKKFCQAYHFHKQIEYPKREIRKKIPEYQIAVGVVRKNGNLLITQRKEQGLLGGLWEFPGEKIAGKESSKIAIERGIQEKLNITVQAYHHLHTVKHAYTHFKVIMDVYLCHFLGGEISLAQIDNFSWISPVQIDKYPFPGANHKFIPKLKEFLGSEKNVD